MVEQIRQEHKQIIERHKKSLTYSLSASLSTILKLKVEDDG